MITIEISEGFGAQIESSLIERAARSTLAHLSVPKDSSLTIVVTDDQQIHELNRQFRDVDAPTDVLSFPAGYSEPESGTIYLGDVIVSYPRAASQAVRGGHAVEDEIQLLVIHGTLHLLGHDHSELEEKARMWAVQGAILSQLGISGGIASNE
jgi:probable rRNA maturation factor